MRGAHAWLGLVPLVLSALLTHAQVPESNEPAGAPTRDTVPGTIPERPEGEEPSPDRFEPTERISEDLSVPFPVDI